MKETRPNGNPDAGASPLFSMGRVGVVITVGFLALANTVWAFWRWFGRPRFIVGVPPFPAEEIPDGKIGHRSIRDQFRHKKDYFAVHLVGETIECVVEQTKTDQ
jgi:hypothetical protein